MKISRRIYPALLFALPLASAAAQSTPVAARGAPAIVRVDARHDGEGVAGAIARLGDVAAVTDASGRATLRIPPSAASLVLTVRRLGFAPAVASLVPRAGLDTTVTVALEELEDELEGVVVSATRSERRVSDEAVRVEVIGKEEIDEKVMMTPGDVTMLLNETAGLRMQVTSPSLGGAGVRIQGLDPRYSLVLNDGLPLLGAAGGGLSLLQVPPVDLGRVEVIKGSASAMHGAQALGGVVNLVSRRAHDEAVRELLLNQTSRGGTDAVLFLASPIDARWSQSLLAGAHRQSLADVDGDGWGDLAAYERVVVRPRVFREDGTGRSLFMTGGVTWEERRGGTLPGRTAPDDQPYAEGLDTRRGDLGLVLREPLREGRAILSARGAITLQEHGHRFGAREERDRHRSGFGELTYTAIGERTTALAGVAGRMDDYANHDVGGFDFRNASIAPFAQLEASVGPRVTVSAAARGEFHEEFGAAFDPRLSVLLRADDDGRLAGWTLRASVATGTLAPTPLTDETEVVGLGELEASAGLRFERATSAALDLAGTLGVVEVNATWFASRVRDALGAEAGPVGPGGYPRLRLVQSSEPARTQGAELVARYLEEPWHVTASYVYIDATRWDDALGRRVPTPLTPRHAVGVVAMREWEERARVGLELYHTGAQALEGDPYRSSSPSTLIVGALAERVIGRARLFLNLENLTDVRQTRHDPLLLPARGRGGRWTTDAWTELAGRTVNGGVRWTF